MLFGWLTKITAILLYNVSYIRRYSFAVSRRRNNIIIITTPIMPNNNIIRHINNDKIVLGTRETLHRYLRSETSSAIRRYIIQTVSKYRATEFGRLSTVS